MLVQVIDVLDDPPVERAADRDVVEDRQVLDVLAQADAAGMRADRDAELGGHQQDREDLVDARPAGRRRSGRSRSRRPAGSCLNMTRFWACSPVATPIPSGSSARDRGRGRGCRPGWSAPRSRAGRARRARASGRSPRRRPRPGWHRPSGRGPARSPRARSRPGAGRPPRSRPTLILKCVQPAATPSRHRRRTLSSSIAEPARPRSCRPDSRATASRPRAPPWSVRGDAGWPAPRRA